MSDISQIALNGVTYDVKDKTARTETDKKVSASGGDIANTKVSAFTASTASYPVPAANDTVKVGFGKIKKFFEDIRNATTGACFIGQIINNCVTENAKLPLSAAQGKALMDLYTKLNSDLSNQRRTITRVRVAITNGVGTYNVTQVGLSGGNCIPVIYSMSDGIFWSEVSVAIQNDLVVVGFSSGQSGWAEVNIFSFE